MTSEPEPAAALSSLDRMKAVQAQYEAGALTFSQACKSLLQAYIQTPHPAREALALFIVGFYQGHFKPEFPGKPPGGAMEDMTALMENVSAAARLKIAYAIISFGENICPQEPKWTEGVAKAMVETFVKTFSYDRRFLYRETLPLAQTCIEFFRQAYNGERMGECVFVESVTRVLTTAKSAEFTAALATSVLDSLWARHQNNRDSYPAIQYHLQNIFLSVPQDGRAALSKHIVEKVQAAYERQRISSESAADFFTCAYLNLPDDAARRRLRKDYRGFLDALAQEAEVGKLKRFFANIANGESLALPHVAVSRPDADGDHVCVVFARQAGEPCVSAENRVLPLSEMRTSLAGMYPDPQSRVRVHYDRFLDRAEKSLRLSAF